MEIYKHKLISNVFPSWLWNHAYRKSKLQMNFNLHPLPPQVTCFHLVKLKKSLSILHHNFKNIITIEKCSINYLLINNYLLIMSKKKTIVS